MSEIIDFSESIDGLELLKERLLSVGATADQIDKAMLGYDNNRERAVKALLALLRNFEQANKGLLEIQKVFGNLVPGETVNTVQEVGKALSKIDDANKQLIGSAASSSDETSKLNARLRVYNQTVNDAVTFADKQIRKKQELQRVSESLANGDVRDIAAIRASNAVKTQQITLEEKLKATKNGSKEKSLNDAIELSALERKLTFLKREEVSYDALTNRIDNYTRAKQGEKAVANEVLRGLNAKATFTQRELNQIQELQRKQSSLNSENAKDIRTLKEKIALSNALLDVDGKRAIKTDLLKRHIADLENGTLKAFITDTEYAKGLENTIRLEQNLSNQHTMLTLLQNKGVMAQQAEIEKLKIKNALILESSTAEEKLSSEITRKERELNKLNSAEGRRLELLKQQIRETRAALNSVVKQEGEKAPILLSSADAKNLVTTKQVNDEIKRKNDYEIENAKTTARLTVEQAKLIASTEKLANDNKRYNESLLDSARQEKGLVGTEKELVDLREKHAAALTKMRAKVTYSSSSQYLELASLKNELAFIEKIQQERIAGAAKQFTSNSQLVSSLRAGLSAIGSSIGFFSAQTMAAAAATYAFTSNLKEALTQGMAFSKSMSEASAAFELSNASYQMKSLEGIVVNLGTSSSLGLNNVAAGLVTIGQAGLDAAQSVSALPSILNAAVIGNVSVSEATNIVVGAMNQFGLKAQDTAKIVDVLAVASTKSSTTVQNLGHALSYVGTVASQTGFKVEESVALLATMAKFGIDKDRAGTAARTFFTNLSNPTTDAARKAIKEYGLELVDAENNTVKLIKIIENLNKIDPVKRTEVIDTVFGAYAASGIAAAAQSVKTYAEMEFAVTNQAKGSASAMRKTMEDNLQGDVDLLKATLDGMRKQIFDTYDQWGRTKVAQLEKYVLSFNDVAAVANSRTGKIVNLGMLNDTADEIRNNTGLAELTKDTDVVITKFDVLIAKVEDAAKTLAVLAAALAVRNTMSSLSVGTKELASTIAGWSVRLQQNSFAQKENEKVTQQLTLALEKQSAVVKAMNGASSTVGMFGKLFSIISKVAGLAGVLYTVYEVGKLLIGSNEDTIQGIVKERNEVENLKNTYVNAREAIENYHNTKERATLNKQLADTKGQLSNLTTVRDTTLGAVNDVFSSGMLNKVGVNKDTISSYVSSFYSDLIASEKDKINSIEAAISAADTPTQRMLKTGDAILQKIEQLSAAEKELVSVQQTAALSGEVLVTNDFISQLDTAKKKVMDIVDSIRQLSATATSTRPVLTVEYVQNLTNVGNIVPQHEASSSSRMRDIRERLKQIEDEQAKRLAENKQISADVEKKVNDLRTQYQELVNRQSGAADNITRSEQQLYTNSLSTAEKTVILKQRLDAVNKNLAELKLKSAQEQPNVPLGAATSVYQSEYATLLSEKINLNSQLNSAETKISKQGAAAASKLESSLKDALSFYTDLQKKINPVEAINLQYNKAVDNLNLLANSSGKYHITEEDRTRTLLYLQNERNAALEKEDEAYKELYMSQHKYVKEAEGFYAKYNSALGGHVEYMASVSKLYGIQLESLLDMSKEIRSINEAVAKGAMPEWAANNIKGKIQEDRKQKVISMVPQAETPKYQSNIATEIMQPFVDKKQFEAQTGAAKISLGTSYAADYAAAQLAYNRELEINQQRYRDGQLSSEKEYNDKRLKIEKDFSESKKQLALQLNTDVSTLNDALLKQEAQNRLSLIGGVMGGLSNIFGAYASVSKEAEAGQKAAFIAQKALAIAQIIMYGEVAAIKAQSEEPFLGMSLSTMIRAQAGISAGLVAGLAIAEYRSDGERGKNNFAGAFDNGGTIPQGSWGIVGEYAPEIVTGPAKVISRKDTAKLLSESGNSMGSITLAPVINISTTGSTSDADDAKILGETVKAVVVKTLQDQIRPNGMLDSWIRSKR